MTSTFLGLVKTRNEFKIIIDDTTFFTIFSIHMYICVCYVLYMHICIYIYIYNTYLSTWRKQKNPFPFPFFLHVQLKTVRLSLFGCGGGRFVEMAQEQLLIHKFHQLTGPYGVTLTLGPQRC